MDQHHDGSFGNLGLQLRFRKMKLEEDLAKESSSRSDAVNVIITSSCTHTLVATQARSDTSE